MAGILADRPLAPRDQRKDFVEFTLERLSSDYARNRIGRSRYENRKICMDIFSRHSCGLPGREPTVLTVFYAGDMAPELLDSYISWRREIKQNSDATINPNRSLDTPGLFSVRKMRLSGILPASVRILFLATPRRSPLRLRLGEKHAA